MAPYFWEPSMICATASVSSRHYRQKNWHVQLILSLLVAHAAAFSHQLCYFKLDDCWGGGASLLYGLPSIVCPRRCGTQALRSGPPPPSRGQMGQDSTKTSMGEGSESVGLSDSLPSFAFPSPRRWNRKGRSTTGMLKRGSVDCPRSGGFQVHVRWGVFVLLRAPCGPLVPPVLVGDRGRPLYFPGLP
jgi:hypothetical protein